MRYIFIIVSSLLLFASCTSSTTTLSGKIDNLDSESKTLTFRGNGVKETTSISENGEFTLKLDIEKAGNYSVFINKKTRFNVFLNSGYDVTISADAKDLSKSLKFSGKGSETNEYYRKTSNDFFSFIKTKNKLYKLNKKDFTEQLTNFKIKIEETAKEYKHIDPFILEKVNSSIEKNFKALEAQYNEANKKTYKLEVGSKSPEFFNYENYNGGTSSMSDFKGKYIYIDVWATWCGPCKAQIPALKKLEKEYRGKNIEFISISTDRPNAHDTWANMVRDKGLKGTQLYMGKNRSFMTDYGIKGIPRFIFIDTEGNIVDANAPRPCQTAAVKKMFAEAGL